MRGVAGTTSFSALRLLSLTAELAPVFSRGASVFSTGGASLFFLPLFLADLVGVSATNADASVTVAFFSFLLFLEEAAGGGGIVSTGAAAAPAPHLFEQGGWAGGWQQQYTAALRRLHRQSSARA